LRSYGIWSYPAGNHEKQGGAKSLLFALFNLSYLDFIFPGEGSFYLFEALGKNSHVGGVGMSVR
jgi:hypothetical protein